MKKMAVNGWEFSILEKIRNFPKWAISRCLGILKGWQGIFPKEDTWVQHQYRTPSLFVRFDCIIENDRLRVLEIEERPAGMGLVQLFNPDFQQRVSFVRNGWPRFKVVISDLRESGHDDLLWLERNNGQQSLVLIRAEPKETKFHRLEPYSVSSLKKKGDKTYGVTFGWWHEFKSLEELPWSDGFVIKPLQGSKCRSLAIWDTKRRQGSSTRSQIERVFHEEKGQMYCQPFVEPMPSGLTEAPYMIYRVFFAYDIPQSRWICLGGAWNARPNLRIHGAKDAIFGPLVPEDNPMALHH